MRTALSTSMGARKHKAARARRTTGRMRWSKAPEVTVCDEATTYELNQADACLDDNNTVICADDRHQRSTKCSSDGPVRLGPTHLKGSAATAELAKPISATSPKKRETRVVAQQLRHREPRATTRRIEAREGQRRRAPPALQHTIMIAGASSLTPVCPLRILSNEYAPVRELRALSSIESESGVSLFPVERRDIILSLPKTINCVRRQSRCIVMAVVINNTIALNPVAVASRSRHAPDKHKSYRAYGNVAATMATAGICWLAAAVGFHACVCSHDLHALHSVRIHAS